MFHVITQKSSTPETKNMTSTTEKPSNVSTSAGTEGMWIQIRINQPVCVVNLVFLDEGYVLLIFVIKILIFCFL